MSKLIGAILVSIPCGLIVAAVIDSCGLVGGLLGILASCVAAAMIYYGIELLGS